MDPGVWTKLKGCLGWLRVGAHCQFNIWNTLWLVKANLCMLRSYMEVVNTSRWSFYRGSDQCRFLQQWFCFLQQNTYQSPILCHLWEIYWKHRLFYTRVRSIRFFISQKVPAMWYAVNIKVTEKHPNADDCWYSGTALTQSLCYWWKCSILGGFIHCMINLTDTNSLKGTNLGLGPLLYM